MKLSSPEWYLTRKYFYAPSLPAILYCSDGFFTSLPLAKNAHKKRGLNMVRKSKAEREKDKLIRM